MKPHLSRFFSLKLLAIVLLLAATASARVTLEQIMSSPFPTELTAAKSANRIAWVFDEKGVRNVFVADAPGFQARKVTNYTLDDGQPIVSVRLTPDGNTVVYVRGSELNREGEVADPLSTGVQPHQQVWSVDLRSGGQPRLLGTMECDREGCEDVELSPDGKTAVWAARKQLWIAPVDGSAEAKSLTYLRGSSTQPQWSPDSTRIAFTSMRGDHSYVAVYDVAKKAITWISPGVDRDAFPRWSPDGRRIAFIRTKGLEQKQPMIPDRANPFAIWVGDAATGQAHEIWHSGMTLNDSLPQQNVVTEAFRFAGDHITFASEQDGWAHLYSVPATGGKEMLLTPGSFEVEQIELARDGKHLIYTSNQDDIDRRHIWKVAITGGTPEAVTKGATMEWSPTELSDGKLVCLGSTGTSPAMPYQVSAGGREMIARDHLAGYPADQLVEPKQVIFKSEDGLEIHGQLFVPRNPIAQKTPAIVFMHGGSRRQMMLGWHYMDYYHNAYAQNQYLASLGYVVLSVNYRTGIMYGRAFREPEHYGWRGASEYQDIVAGARYLQSLPNVDAEKIGLWGGSYGGYLTAMGLARNSDIFKAGVDLHGVHDWSARMGRFGQQGGAAPDMREATQLAFSSSPNSSINNWKSPVLLIQGDDDRNVDFTQTVDLVQRLRSQAVPYELLVFPDEIHGFLRWESWMRAYAAGADFFNRVLVQNQKIALGTFSAQSKEGTAAAK